MASGAPGPASLNSSFANTSRALSSKVSTQGYAVRAEAASERTVTVRQNKDSTKSYIGFRNVMTQLGRSSGFEF